ncbi:MAG: GTPase Era [Pseudomonadota bacterium]
MSKAIFVAIAGIPNVGKSTLLNRIIGQKISIVSPKVQTTRTIINGIYVDGDTQIIFVDTPGIFTPKKTLEKAIVTTAWSGLDGIDLVLILVDAVRGFTEETRAIINRLEKQKIKPILIINKTDLVTKEKLNRLSLEYKNLNLFREVITVSALEGEGVTELLSYLKLNAPEHEWYFPEDQLTTAPIRLLASEITREKLFLNLSHELPYNLTVETENWEEQKNGSVKITQAIFVSRDTHKQIILGNKGKMIKKIGMLAREDIEDFLQTKVHLFLFVKVRENWVNDRNRYNYLGMQF